MANDVTQIAELVAELLFLKRQQLQALSDAMYLGWTAETNAGNSERGARIATLIKLLVDHSRRPN